MHTENTQNQASRIAKEILSLARNTLMVHLRFLDEALFRLTPEQVDGRDAYATDGEKLYYTTGQVFKRFKKEKTAVARDFLHIVLHCVYRHAFVSSLLDKRLWNLAVDIAVESTILSLGLNAVSTSKDVAQQSALQLIQTYTRILTAEKVNQYLRSQNLSDQELGRLEALFFTDDHSPWYQASPSDEQDGERQGDSDSDGGASSSGPTTSRQADEDTKDPGKVDTALDAADDEGTSNEQASQQSQIGGRTSLEQEWRDIAQRMQTDLETASVGQGTQAGGLLQQLGQLNRERYDYAAFLKKFAVLGEAMQVNDDEFDYIYYTYGLSLYGNLPLIEPLEYKEVKRIRDFVIAIDTSGSTSGELVQRFLQKTYNILLSTESFFSKINLRIIQCDAIIQESIKITKPEEFQDYVSNYAIKGLGGTDFRPVFAYVDQQLAHREFSNLKGLIYFTDGMGTFPAKKPNYETAFVFIKDQYSDVAVPSWAIKLVLEKEEL